MPKAPSTWIQAPYMSQSFRMACISSSEEVAKRPVLTSEAEIATMLAAPL